jgi:ferredoxin
VSSEVPFKDRLAALGPNVVIYNSAKGTRMDLKSILSHATDRTHIYTCGPTRLMDAVTATAESLNIPLADVHMEQFTVITSGDPFTVELAQSKKVLEVGATQTLLDVLKSVGLDVDSSCEVGNCGTCRVDFTEGRVLHKGTGLLEEEKCGAMLSCVSRGVGTIVVDL